MITHGSRVAFVSMHTSPVQAAGTGDAGGMNVLLTSVASSLAAQGIQVDLITRALGTPGVREVVPGVTLRELAAGGEGPIAKEALIHATDEFGERLAELAGRGGPGYDIIHAHYWLSGLAALPASLELGIPLVQSFHTVAGLKNATRAAGQAEEPEFRVRSEAFLAGQAAAIVAGSSVEAAALLEHAAAPPARVWLVPPGVDTHTFRPRGADVADRVRAAFGIAAHTPIIAVVGRIQPLKDQNLALRVLAEIHTAGPPPVLVIAGESTPGDEPYVTSLLRTAERLGVDSRVRFVGALDHDRLAELLAAASVTLIPSTSETFGLVALESAASGTPAVGWHDTGLRESISHGVSGLLMRSRDPVEWAGAVGGLLDDGAKLERMSHTARHHAEGFTWATAAAGLRGVYASVFAALQR